jgi:hypothetical protein
MIFSLHLLPQKAEYILDIQKSTSQKAQMVNVLTGSSGARERSFARGEKERHILSVDGTFASED